MGLLIVHTMTRTLQVALGYRTATTVRASGWLIPESALTDLSTPLFQWMQITRNHLRQSYTAGELREGLDQNAIARHPATSREEGHLHASTSRRSRSASNPHRSRHRFKSARQSGGWTPKKPTFATLGFQVDGNCWSPRRRRLHCRGRPRHRRCQTRADSGHRNREAGSGYRSPVEGQCARRMRHRLRAATRNLHRTGDVSAGDVGTAGEHAPHP
jgi:hypothetical protein